MAFICTKRASKDNKDGLVLLQLKCQPKDIPHEIKYGNSGDRFILTIQMQSDTNASIIKSIFEGQRVSIDDQGDGSVNLKFVALPAQVGDDILYAKNGSTFLVEYEQIYVQSENLPNSIEVRNATFKRFQIIIQEPAFWDFLEKKDRWELLTDPFTLTFQKPQIAIEVFYRLTQCHSRNEIRTNAAVCEKTERLIREYRRQLWKQEQIKQVHQDHHRQYP